MKNKILALILCVLLCCSCSAGAETEKMTTADIEPQAEAADTSDYSQRTEEEDTLSDVIPDTASQNQTTALNPQAALQNQSETSNSQNALQNQSETSNPQNALQDQNINPGAGSASQNLNTDSRLEQGTADAHADSAVSGVLSVSGTQLQDASHTLVQLRGISTHGLAWYPDYINEECFRQLKNEWGINTIRLAMYTAESGGYCTDGNQDDLKALVRNGVDYATSCGMYVIIDWHILSDGNPNTYLEEAKSFFQEMAAEYADHTNVLYEICNEPNGQTSWSEIKGYAEQMIEVIRQEDPDGIILIGTPNWSQYVEQAAADPVTDYENIMYTLHFYAATHTDDLRDSLVRAVEAGLPIFVSEFGICDASGSGAIDAYQADKWIELLDAYGISYMAWNLSNKSETSAILKSSCGKISGFTQEDLSDSGKWLYEKMKGHAAAGSPDEDNKNASPSSENSPAENSQPSRNDTTGNKSAENNAAENDADGNMISENKTEENEAGRNESSESKTVQNDLEITLKIVNTWTQDEETYFQCDVTVTNSAKEAQNDWMIHLSFNCDIALQNGWNGMYEAEGSILTISSMDYNSSIGTGGSVENIGFILSAKESRLFLE